MTENTPTAIRLVPGPWVEEWIAAGPVRVKILRCPCGYPQLPPMTPGRYVLTCPHCDSRFGVEMIDAPSSP